MKRIWKAGLAALIALCLGGRALAAEDEVALVEPFFTRDATVGAEFNLFTEITNRSGGQDYTVSASGTAVFLNKLEVTFTLPFIVADEDANGDERGFGDQELDLKYKLFESKALQLVVSPGLGLGFPYGEGDKGLGGTGFWNPFIVAGKGFDIGEGLPRLTVQMELGYEQQITTTNAQRAEARDAGLSSVKEKAFIANLAVGADFWDGKFTPGVELNLRSVLDSTFAKDEGVRVSISPGFWLYPFKEFPMGFGLASQWAVSEDKDFFSNVLFAIKYPL